MSLNQCMAVGQRVRFIMYFCGMADGLFSEKIMLWPAVGKFEKLYAYPNGVPPTLKVSDVIERFKADAHADGQALGELETEHLQADTVYVKADDAMLELREDKQLSDMFSYFSLDELTLVFISAGGASFHCQGYQFIVHTNDDIHKNTPHVHVKRSGCQTRYYLETLTRFPNDKFSREFQRDEKRIILPYLRENKERLLGYWNHYLNGYLPPAEDENGMQYYKES